MNKQEAIDSLECFRRNTAHILGDNDEKVKTIETCIMLVREAEETERWIPVSERLPEPRMAVLGYAPRYQNIYALYYDSAYGWMVWSPVRDDFFPNSQGEIIAWMPLPEPYKEDKA